MINFFARRHSWFKLVRVNVQSAHKLITIQSLVDLDG